jgi:hypothetical protein
MSLTDLLDSRLAQLLSEGVDADHLRRGRPILLDLLSAPPWLAEDIKSKALPQRPGLWLVSMHMPVSRVIIKIGKAWNLSDRIRRYVHPGPGMAEIYLSWTRTPVDVRDLHWARKLAMHVCYVHRGALLNLLLNQANAAGVIQYEESGHIQGKATEAWRIPDSRGVEVASEDTVDRAPVWLTRTLRRCIRCGRECGGGESIHGWCRACYMYWRRNGTERPIPDRRSGT